MKPGVILLIAALAACQPARADVPTAAADAFDACMRTVLDGAPLTHAPTTNVQVLRDTRVNACTIRVLKGDAAAIRAELLERVGKRPEGFTPAKTRFDPRDYASRDTLCGSAPAARTSNVLISTSKPSDTATHVRLMASVVVSRERDARCDRDMGLQPPLLPKSGRGT